METEFINFWPGFEDEPNVFSDYLSKNHYVAEKLKQAGVSKVIFESVFPAKARSSRFSRGLAKLVIQSAAERPSKDPGCLTIWYSGENIRPPLSNKFDAYLSFDLDSFGGRNTYFPLIFLSLNPYQLNTQKRLGKEYDLEVLLNNRELKSKKIPNSVCIIAGKHPIRKAVVEEFQKYFRVDVFGGMSNTPVNEKYSVAKNYQYMFCLENDLYPGYVTEKLVEAYVCETVPLYWGATDGNTYLNSRSFMNLRDFEDIATWAKRVSSISETQYLEIYEQPLLQSEPPIQLQLTKLFETILHTKKSE
jgi:hypothetical protein